MEVDIWTYRDTSITGTAITGYDVEAIDGGIGKVDEATEEVGQSYVVVDTGPWIFGKKVLLPAGVIDRIDVRAKKVYVNRTKDEVKNAPEYDPDRILDESYRGDGASGQVTDCPGSSTRPEKAYRDVTYRSPLACAR
jgi:hypothetical protein